MRDRRLTRIAGLVLVRQKPGSAKGVMFITIEDETGVANLVIWPSLYEQRRRVVLSSSLLIVDGKVQREGEVVAPTADIGCSAPSGHSDRNLAVAELPDADWVEPSGQRVRRVGFITRPARHEGWDWAQPDR